MKLTDNDYFTATCPNCQGALRVLDKPIKFYLGMDSLPLRAAMRMMPFPLTATCPSCSTTTEFVPSGNDLTYVPKE